MGARLTKVDPKKKSQSASEKGGMSQGSEKLNNVLAEGEKMKMAAAKSGGGSNARSSYLSGGSNLGDKSVAPRSAAANLKGGSARLLRKSKQNVRGNAASKQAKLSAKKLY